jgi:hypothetical protein
MVLMERNPQNPREFWTADVVSLSPLCGFPVKIGFILKDGEKRTGGNRGNRENKSSFALFSLLPPVLIRTYAFGTLKC